MRIVLTRFAISLATAGLLLVCTLTPNRADAILVATLDAGTDFTVGDKMNFAGNGTGDVSDSGHGNTIAQILFLYLPPSEIGMYTVVDAGFNFAQPVSEAALTFAAGIPEVKVIDLSNRNLISTEVLQAAVDAGKLLVVNSGNSGRGSPEGIAELAPLFEGAMIVVGAIDPDGSVAVYTNLPGPTAPYYILAPGSNGFNSGEGTSFAKPHVSGTAGLLFVLFPNLTAREVAAILFETATPLADPASGLRVLNTTAALMPVEPVETPTSSSGGGSAAGVFGVVGGIAIITALVKSRQKPLETTLVLDKYRRGYSLDLTETVDVRDYRGTIGAILQSLHRLDRTFVYGASPNASTYVRISTPTAQDLQTSNPAYSLNDDATIEVEPSFSLIHAGRDGKGYRFHINNSAAPGFGALGLASRARDPIEFLTNTSFTTPFLGFSANGFASQMTYPVGDNTSFSFGLAAVNEDTRYGLDSEAAIFEFSRKGERFGSSVYFGRLSEQGSLFGGSNGGAFAVDENETYSLGLAANYRFTENAHLLGNYTYGFSRVDDTGNSLLHNFSGVESNSWGLGLVMDNAFVRDDRIGFAVSQPLRVTDGSADFTIPHAIDANNIVSSTTERVSLSPAGRETTFEAFYRMRLGRNGTFTTFLLHKQQPDHDNDAADETSILGIAQYRF